MSKKQENPMARKWVKKEPKKKKKSWEYEKSSEPLIKRKEKKKSWEHEKSSEPLIKRKEKRQPTSLSSLMLSNDSGQPSLQQQVMPQRQAMPQQQAMPQEGSSSGTGSYLSPEEMEWANMMIGAINQMGGQTTDARAHQQLAMQYLDLLGSLQPERDSGQSIQEAMQMAQIGEMFGDQDMMNEAQNMLRGSYDMEALPEMGTPEFTQGAMQSAFMDQLGGDFPTQQEEGQPPLSSQDIMSNLEVLMQAGEQVPHNPNMIKDYQQDYGWGERKKAQFDDKDTGFFKNLFTSKSQDDMRRTELLRQLGIE